MTWLTSSLADTTHAPEVCWDSYLFPDRVVCSAVLGHRIFPLLPWQPPWKIIRKPSMGNMGISGSFLFIKELRKILRCYLRPSSSFSLSIFWPCHVACGISAPSQGSNLCPLQWECRVLTIALPVNSHRSLSNHTIPPPPPWDSSILMRRLFWDEVSSWSPNKKWGQEPLNFGLFPQLLPNDLLLWDIGPRQRNQATLVSLLMSLILKSPFTGKFNFSC